MKFYLLLLVLALLTHHELRAQSTSPGSPECPATTPNGRTHATELASGDHHGNEVLATVLWGGGTVVFRPGGPGFIMRDGALAMKWPWWRAVRGQLMITGRRLDGLAPPLRARISDGYGDIGFRPTYVIFPTPGCWEVTGHLGDASLTFVTRVVKIDVGPSGRADW